MHYRHCEDPGESRGTKQSSLRLQGPLDCFASLAMTTPCPHPAALARCAPSEDEIRRRQRHLAVEHDLEVRDRVAVHVGIDDRRAIAGRIAQLAGMARKGVLADELERV